MAFGVHILKKYYMVFDATTGANDIKLGFALNREFAEKTEEDPGGLSTLELYIIIFSISLVLIAVSIYKYKDY